MSPEDVTAMVLGGHGDTMVPLIRYSTVAGIPLTDLVKMAGSPRSVSMRSCSGRVTAAPRSSDCSNPARPITRRPQPRWKWPTGYLKNKKRVLPCAAYLNGEYHVKGLYAGVPVVISAKGVERVIELDLNSHERDAFMNRSTW